MPKAEKPAKETYTEVEAAQALEISVSRLRMLLDEHIFNDGTSRPPGLMLLASDLVLLRFWLKSTPNPKVVHMPKRQ